MVNAVLEPSPKYEAVRNVASHVGQAAYIPSVRTVPMSHCVSMHVCVTGWECVWFQRRRVAEEDWQRRRRKGRDNKFWRKGDIMDDFRYQDSWSQNMAEGGVRQIIVCEMYEKHLGIFFEITILIGW